MLSSVVGGIFGFQKRALWQGQDVLARKPLLVLPKAVSRQVLLCEAKGFHILIQRQLLCEALTM